MSMRPLNATMASEQSECVNNNQITAATTTNKTTNNKLHLVHHNIAQCVPHARKVVVQNGDERPDLEQLVSAVVVLIVVDVQVVAKLKEAVAAHLVCNKRVSPHV